MSVDLSTPGGASFVLGYKGQISVIEETVTGTRINENATAIGYGKVVGAGASGSTCKPLGTGDKVVGIAVMNPLLPADYTSHAVSYPQYASVPLMEIGKMFVQPVEEWLDGDAVYGIVSQTGEIGSAKGGGASADRIIVPGASFIGAGSANTIGEIKIVGGQTITLGT